MLCLVSAAVMAAGALFHAALPLNPRWLWAFLRTVHRHGHSEAVRRVGTTRFADESEYDDVRLTDDQRADYIQLGYTVIRRALRPKLLIALRETLRAEFGEMNNVWSHYRSHDSDALLDFYLCSNLGSIVADLLSTPGTETSSDDPLSVHLWRDFVYHRHPGKVLTSWHVDIEDCDTEALPPNQTRGSRPRIWIPLVSGVEPPHFVNMSKILGMVPEDTARQYWRGQLQRNVIEKTGQPTEAWGENFVVRLPELQLGDIVLHAPCVYHLSPTPLTFGRPVPILFPTYAAGSSLVRPLHALQNVRACRTQAQAATAAQEPCLPPAFPKARRPSRDKELRFPKSGSLRKWLHCSLFRDMRHGLRPHV